MTLLSVALATLLSFEQSKSPAKILDLSNGVTIAFPVAPKRDTEDASPNEKVWSAYVGNVYYLADSQTIPHGMAADDQLLSAALANFLKFSNGTLVSKKPTILSGWLGYRFLAKISGTSCWGRVYCTHDRVFVIGVVSAEELSPAGNAFLDSLKFPKGEVGPHTLQELTSSTGAKLNPVTLEIGDGYKVTFPFEPHSSQPDERPKSSLWLCLDGNTSYTAIEVTDPEINESDESKEISQMMYGTLGSAKFSLTSQKDVLLSGWKCLEFQAIRGDSTLWGRVFRIQHSLVELAVSAVGGKFPVGSRGFLESLSLPGGMPNGPHLSAGPEFKTYKLDDIGMQVELPTKPERVTEVVSHEGVSIPVIRYAAGDDGRGFIISSFDIPASVLNTTSKGNIEALLISLMNSVERGLHVSFVDAKTTEAKGKTVRVAEMRSDNAAGRIIMTYYAGHVLSVMALGPKATYPSPEFSRYFDSIQEIKQ